MEDFGGESIEADLALVLEEKEQKICQQEKDIGSLKREIKSLKHEIDCLLDKKEWNSLFFVFCEKASKLEDIFIFCSNCTKIKNFTKKLKIT